MPTARPVKIPRVSQKEREELRRKSVHINRVFDAISAYPGGFSAEFARRKAEQKK